MNVLRWFPAISLIAASLSGCRGEAKPNDDECLRAADNIVTLFIEQNADQGPLGRRAAQNQHQSFFESCRDTGTAKQARCAAEAESVPQLELCR